MKWEVELMARFVMLLRHGPNDFDGLGEGDFAAMMGQFAAWTDQLQKGGNLVAVERLKVGGRTLRKRDQLVVDGPFAGAKEAVVGLYVVEARDADHATELASGCPCIQYGGAVDLRPCDDFPAGDRGAGSGLGRPTPG
jgi:hypothetical protein